MSSSIVWRITPCPKPRQTQSDKWKKRPAVMRYRAFRDAVRVSGMKLPHGCKVVFWLPMPRSWSSTKRARMAGRPHQTKPDLDNLIKGLWDAVTRRDERMWSVQAEKRWTSTPAGSIEVFPPSEMVEETEADTDEDEAA